jgi:hypothetical protein
VSELLKILLVTAIALGVAAGGASVGDGKTVVPPPESVVEEFARQIAARRYDRAMEHIDNRSGISFTTVRLGGEALQERAGDVDSVEGEPGEMAGDRATASAVLTTRRAGRIRYSCGLQRRNGLWKIAEWNEVSSGR